MKSIMTNTELQQQTAALTIAQALQQAIAYHQQGQLQDAERFYRAILQAQPNHPEANHNLGVLAVSVNQPVAGLPYIMAALAANPNFAEAHNSLGNTYKALGRLDEAAASYRQALEIKPDYVDAHINMGNSLQERGRLDEAETSYRRMLEIKPDHAPAYYTLGNILKNMERIAEAEASYRRALEIKPDYVDAYVNIGNILQEMGRLDDAEASYRRALEIQSDHAPAHYNLGNTLRNMGRLDEAEASYRRALEIQPDYAEAHTNLGNTFKDMGRLNEAEAGYRRALQINPDYVVARLNLGVILRDLGRLAESEANCLLALQIKPDYAEAHCNLGATLQGLGRFDEAEISYRRALEVKPDYAEAHCNLGAALQGLGRLDEAEISYRRALEIKPSFAEVHSNLISILDMTDTADLAELQSERNKWDETHAAPLWQTPIHCHDRSPDRRLRIGYVSADFRDHSAAKVFGGMLTCYDRSQFEVFAYSNSKRKDDGFTDLFKQSVTVWRNIVGLADEAVAQTIREDRIDILVDLSGHSAGNRLLVFARKPAPIQITAWGYAHGTGMRAMDVFFADPVMVPPQNRHYFREEVRYLPSVVGSFFTERFPDVNELPALSSGIISFGSLNRLAKVTERTYRAWVEILQALPESRLILKTGELNDASTRSWVAGHFTKAGVAAERIVMHGKTSWYEHMQTHHQIDIALDPFPLGGGVTTLEDLMMGVPVISLRWPTMAGGVSASIMTTLGLPDWIAKTQEHYVELAIRKAADLQSLAALRRQLRGIFIASVLGDQTAYARAVEQEYRQLWREWRAKN